MAIVWNLKRKKGMEIKSQLLLEELWQATVSKVLTLISFFESCQKTEVMRDILGRSWCMEMWFPPPKQFWKGALFLVSYVTKGCLNQKNAPPEHHLGILSFSRPSLKALSAVPTARSQEEAEGTILGSPQKDASSFPLWWGTLGPRPQLLSWFSISFL